MVGFCFTVYYWIVLECWGLRCMEAFCRHLVGGESLLNQRVCGGAPRVPRSESTGAAEMSFHQSFLRTSQTDKDIFQKQSPCPSAYETALSVVAHRSFRQVPRMAWTKGVVWVLTGAINGDLPISRYKGSLSDLFKITTERRGIRGYICWNARP